MIEASDETLYDSGMNEIYFFQNTYKKTISKLANNILISRAKEWLKILCSCEVSNVDFLFLACTSTN